MSLHIFSYFELQFFPKGGGAEVIIINLRVEWLDEAQKAYLSSFFSFKYKVKLTKDKQEFSRTKFYFILRWNFPLAQSRGWNVLLSLEFWMERNRKEVMKYRYILVTDFRSWLAFRFDYDSGLKFDFSHFKRAKLTLLEQLEEYRKGVLGLLILEIFQDFWSDPRLSFAV